MSDATDSADGPAPPKARIEKVKITPEMIARGVAELRAHISEDQVILPLEDIVARIYYMMTVQLDHFSPSCTKLVTGSRTKP